MLRFSLCHVLLLSTIIFYGVVVPFYLATMRLIWEIN